MIAAGVYGPARLAGQTRALAQTASDELGGVDALVNIAAIVSLARRPFDEILEDEWDRVFEVNVKGAWLCARALAPLLRSAGGGSIVNLASEVAFSGALALPVSEESAFVTGQTLLVNGGRLLG